METIIFCILLGSFFSVFGIFNLKGRVGFIHKQWITEKTQKSYGRLLGIGTVLIGLSLILFGICSFAAEKLQNEQIYLAGSVILLVLFVAGFIISLYAMIRYNKSIL